MRDISEILIQLLKFVYSLHMRLAAGCGWVRTTSHESRTFLTSHHMRSLTCRVVSSHIFSPFFPHNPDPPSGAGDRSHCVASLTWGNAGAGV
jgi:hypothetical protein